MKSLNWRRIRRVRQAYWRFVLLVFFQVTVFGGIAAAQSWPSPLKLSYEAYLGPFYIMSADVTLELVDGRYRVSTQAKTEGFAVWIFPWNNQAVAKGRRENGKLIPASLRMKSFWNKKHRKARLRYAMTTPVIEELAPAPDGIESKPVPDELTANTVDPLSMALKLMLAMAIDGNCPGTFRVFDGRRRYDMVFTQGVMDTLPEHASSIFSGKAQACALAIDRIEGFWKESKLVTDTKAAPTLWMARPIENGPPLPIKFEASYRYGNIRIHLTRLEMGSEIRELEND
jgi:hypothetical protein